MTVFHQNSEKLSSGCCRSANRVIRDRDDGECGYREGDGIIDDPLDELLRDKVGERPYGALRELHRTAKFVSNAEQNAPRSQRLVKVSRGTYLVRQAGAFLNPCCEGAIRGMIDMECGDDCVEAVCG
jgi:hypothetical protein